MVGPFAGNGRKESIRNAPLRQGAVDVRGHRPTAKSNAARGPGHVNGALRRRGGVGDGRGRTRDARDVAGPRAGRGCRNQGREPPRSSRPRPTTQEPVRSRRVEPAAGCAGLSSSGRRRDEVDREHPARRAGGRARLAGRRGHGAGGDQPVEVGGAGGLLRAAEGIMETTCTRQRRRKPDQHQERQQRSGTGPTRLPAARGCHPRDLTAGTAGVSLPGTGVPDSEGTPRRV